MEHLQSKICIVGGGPAGITASLFLTQNNIPHLLVDKANFPRDKVCGESFDGRVYRILEELSPAYLTELQSDDLLLKTWNYKFQSKKIDLAMTFPKANLPRISIDRSQLDHFLYQKAKQSKIAQIINGHKIKEVIDHQDYVRLRSDQVQIDTDLVIMATGAQSLVDYDPSLFVFSRTYYEGVQVAGEKGLEAYYFDQPVKGCLFLCPLSQNRYNVELAVQKAAYKAGGIKMEDLLQAYLKSRPRLLKRFQNAKALGKARGTSMLLQSKTQLSKSKILYAGSSAFCVNPITGFGVGNAMSMGKIAAKHIQAYWTHPNFVTQVEKNYRKEVKRRFRNILLMNRLLNLIQRRFSFVEPLLSPFLRSNLIQNLLIRPDFIKLLRMPRFYTKLKKEYYSKT